jgi:ribosomal RNA assembly protein
MTEFAYQVKIPKDRVAVLIGKNGETKKLLSSHTKTKIDVDSTEGEVNVTGEDALNLYSTREIIKAIGRGFNPETALLLLKQDYAFDMINLPDFENPNQFQRIKGRVIGKDGKSRRLIEEYTEVYISVYGKTVAFIGQADTIHLARKAIEMLIKGSPHANVYRWLERRRRELKRREYEDDFSKHLRTKDDKKEKKDELLTEEEKDSDADSDDDDSGGDSEPVKSGSEE